MRRASGAIFPLPISAINKSQIKQVTSLNTSLMRASIHSDYKETYVSMPTELVLFSERNDDDDDDVLACSRGLLYDMRLDNRSR